MQCKKEDEKKINIKNRYKQNIENDVEAKQHNNLRCWMQIAKQYLHLSYLQIIA